MKKLMILSLAVASGVAMAQDMKPVGLAIRAGILKPQGQAARAESESWSAGGIDFKLKDLKFGKTNTSLTISVDFATQGSFQTVPICINHVTRRKEWYYFGGAGVSFTSVPRIVGPSTDKSESVELAYQVGLGYDFQSGKSPLFAELKYMGNGEDKLSAFGIFVGVRL